MKDDQGKPERKKGKGAKKRDLQKRTKHHKHVKRKGKEAPDPEKPETLDATNTDALLPAIRKALEWHGRGYAYGEIGLLLIDEFPFLGTAPSEATVWRWCEDARQALLQDCKALKAREVGLQLQRTDALLRKWLPIATIDLLPISRVRMTAQGPEAVTDENSYREQAKAADIVLKAMAHRANLLGVESGGGLPGEDGSQKTPEQIQAFIANLAAKFVAGLPSANPKAKRGITLELESGAENLEKVA